MGEGEGRRREGRRREGRRREGGGRRGRGRGKEREGEGGGGGTNRSGFYDHTQLTHQLTLNPYLFFILFSSLLL